MLWLAPGRPQANGIGHDIESDDSYPQIPLDGWGQSGGINQGDSIVFDEPAGISGLPSFLEEPDFQGR